MSLKDWFVNASIGAAYNETPAAGAAMAASGFYKNDEGNWRLDPDRLGLDEMRKGLAGLGTVGLTAYSIPWLSPYFAPGTAGGNFIGTLAAGEAVRLGANMLYNNLTDSETGDYMKDAFNEIGGNNISNPIVKGIAEGVFSATDPAYWTGAPILTRAFGGIKSLANKVADAVTTPIKEGMAEAFTKASPKYSFKYNPKTGKFDVSLDESPMDISETAPTKLVRVNRGDTKGLSFQPSRKALPQFSPMSNEDHMLIYQALQNSGYAPEGTNININNTADGLTIEGDGLNLAIATLDIPTFMLNIRTNGTIDIPTSKVNYGSVINLPSTLSTESPIILKGFNNHLQGGDAVLMFKEYGGDYPVRLYRILPSNQEALTSSVPEPGRENYVGMWFTTDVEKPAWYAHQARQGKGKTASDPLDLQYVDIPASKLEQYKASNIITEPIDYERFEDYLIPLDYPRLTVSVPEGKLMQVSQWLRENELPLSPLMSELMKYVPEARERYGLVGNTDITDEEIALALYKQAVELGEGTAATYPSGEPLLLFRGDTRDYTLLRPRISPTDLASGGGTMDNSLGNLFLGEFPYTYLGADRYLGTYLNFDGNESLKGSGTGSKIIFEGKPRSEVNVDLLSPIGYPLYNYSFNRRGNNSSISVFKLPASMMESGVNNLNAFVVLTPNVRDASKEISVLNDDWLVKAGSAGNPNIQYYGPKIKEIYDEYGFPLLLDIETGEIVGNGLAGGDLRKQIAAHYKNLLENAESNLEGLLRSDKNSSLRDEHDNYTYFALPNFNIGGAKHILPYDLRRARNWGSKNIYLGFGDSKPNSDYNLEDVYNFIENDIYPRLIEQGHDPSNINVRSIPIRKFDPINDFYDSFISKGSTAEGMFNHITNDVSLNNNNFGLVVHELGGHGVRFNLWPYNIYLSRPEFNKRLKTAVENPGVSVEIPIENKSLFNDTEKLLLSKAYPWVERKTKGPKSTLDEQGAVNTQLRANISKRNGYKTGRDLDIVIDNLSDEEILIDLMKLHYTKDIVADIAELSGTSPSNILNMSKEEFSLLISQHPEISNWVKEIKTALKVVGVFGGVITGSQVLDQSESYKHGGRLKLVPKAKSGIHIKKKNRGKFTEYCGGKVTDKCILKAKHSSNPTLRKRATFALNARKWNKKK